MMRIGRGVTDLLIFVGRVDVKHEVVARISGHGVVEGSTGPSRDLVSCFEGVIAIEIKKVDGHEACCSSWRGTDAARGQDGSGRSLIDSG